MAFKVFCVACLCFNACLLSFTGSLHFSYKSRIHFWVLNLFSRFWLWIILLPFFVYFCEVPFCVPEHDYLIQPLVVPAILLLSASLTSIALPVSLVNIRLHWSIPLNFFSTVSAFYVIVLVNLGKHFIMWKMWLKIKLYYIKTMLYNTAIFHGAWESQGTV